MRVYTQTYFLTSQNINKDKMRLKFLLGHEKKNHERGWGMGDSCNIFNNKNKRINKLSFKI